MRKSPPKILIGQEENEEEVFAVSPIRNSLIEGAFEDQNEKWQKEKHL